MMEGTNSWQQSCLVRVGAPPRDDSLIAKTLQKAQNLAVSRQSPAAVTGNPSKTNSPTVREDMLHRSHIIRRSITGQNDLWYST